MFRKSVLTDRGTLTFTSTTELDPERQQLLLSETHTMASVLGVSVMLLVSLTACTVPTLRALRIAPMDALRQEA